MPNNQVKRPSFTLTTGVKRFVYAPAVIAAFAEASIKHAPFTWPEKPADIGQFRNPLIFPRLFEVDLNGQIAPASAVIWDAFVLQRLRTGGVEPIGAGAVPMPSEAYNIAFLTFHLGQLASTRARADFQGYIRRLLLDHMHAAHPDEDPETAQVLRNTLAWLESYSKQLTATQLADAKVEGPQQHITVKQKVLAYKLLLVHNEVQLPNNHDIDQQVDYIHDQIGSDKATIRRYLNSNLSAAARKRKRDYIYTDENFDQARQFIRRIRPTLDTGGYRLNDVSEM